MIRDSPLCREIPIWSTYHASPAWVGGFTLRVRSLCIHCRLGIGAARPQSLLLRYALPPGSSHYSTTVGFLERELLSLSCPDKITAFFRILILDRKLSSFTLAKAGNITQY